MPAPNRKNTDARMGPQLVFNVVVQCGHARWWSDHVDVIMRRASHLSSKSCDWRPKPCSARVRTKRASPGLLVRVLLLIRFHGLHPTEIHRKSTIKLQNKKESKHRNQMRHAMLFFCARRMKSNVQSHCMRKDEMRDSQNLSHEAHVSTIRHHVLRGWRGPIRPQTGAAIQQRQGESLSTTAGEDALPLSQPDTLGADPHYLGLMADLETV